MNCLRLLVVATLSILTVSAEAQMLADCGLQARVSPLFPSAKDPLVITFSGQMNYCDSIRVAAVGEGSFLGLSQPAGALNVIVARRPSPGPDACPAVEVPFEIEARLPSRLPAIDAPGPFSVGVYYRSEDEKGNLIDQISCGTVDLSIGEGYRSEIAFHEGRFMASVTWNTSDKNESGFAVPADGTDSGLFWFFAPGNWELMVKVLDGCAVNQHYWVIGAAATDVLFTLRITDKQTGAIWTYTSPGGHLAPAFSDVQAFSCTGTS